MINAGYIIIDTSRTRGGVTYVRDYEKQRKQGRGHKVTIRTVKQIDNAKLVAETDALVQSARYVLRKHCAKTSLGWFARAGVLADIEAEFAELRYQAQEANERAQVAGSARRVQIGYVPLVLDFGLPGAAEEIRRTIAELCQDFVDTLRAGDVTGLGKLFIRAKNLEQLAIGPGRAVIIRAIENAKEARSELRTALRTKLPPARTGSRLHLDGLLDCLELFDPAESVAAAVGA